MRYSNNFSFIINILRIPINIIKQFELDFNRWRLFQVASVVNRNLNTYRALSKTIQSGLVKTAHDCSEGGLAVAVAEMCIGGRTGAEIDIDGTGDGDVWGRLWGESLGRFVVAVSPENDAAFRAGMKGHPLTILGAVTDTDSLTIVDADDTLISTPVKPLVDAWKGTLDMTGGVA